MILRLQRTFAMNILMCKNANTQKLLLWIIIVASKQKHNNKTNREMYTLYAIVGLINVHSMGDICVFQ